jgi:hypothetical protein
MMLAMPMWTGSGYRRIDAWQVLKLPGQQIKKKRYRYRERLRK